MKNLIWIVVAGGVVLGGWWLFSGDSPADVARDVSDQVNAPEVLASAGDTVGDAVVVVTDSVSGSLNESAVAADRITDGEPQPQIESEAEEPDAARTMMPADADPVGGAGTTTLTDRAGTLNADVGGDSAAALGEAGGVNAFADNGTASTASVTDSDVSLPEGAVSTMNGTAEDAPVIAPADREQPAAEGMDTTPAGETETSTVPETEEPVETQSADAPAATEDETPIETNEDGVIENLEATREDDEIILSEGDDEEPASDTDEQAGETPATAPASEDTDAASADAAVEGVATDDESDAAEADGSIVEDTATLPETDSGETSETEAEANADGNANAEARTDDQIEPDAETSDATPAPEAAAEETSEPEATSDTAPAPEATLGDATGEPAEPESDITAAEDDVDAAEAEVPEQTVETSDSDAVTTTPMEDEALTVDGFNLTRAEELIDNSSLSDEEKETLKSGLQDAQNTPELLEMMLEELRETLTEEEATPAVE